LPDVIFDFNKVGDGAMVLVTFTGGGRQTFHISADECSHPDTALPQLGALEGKLTAWMQEALLREIAAEKVKLYAYGRVHSGQLSYGAVIVVRRAIELAIAAVGDERLEVLWTDDLVDEEGGAEPGIIPNFKKRSMPLLVHEQRYLRFRTG
jgi:hypothetical protein